MFKSRLGCLIMIVLGLLLLIVAVKEWSRYDVLIMMVLSLLLLTIAVKRWSRYKGWKTILLYSIFLGLGVYLFLTPTEQIHSGLTGVLSLLAAVSAVWQFKQDSE